MARTASPLTKTKSRHLDPVTGSETRRKSAANQSGDTQSRTTTTRKQPDASPASQSAPQSTPGIAVAELKQLAADWRLDGELRGHSQRTLLCRDDLLGKLFWFLQHRQHPTCGLGQLRAFFLYLKTGHEEPGGRWDNPRMRAPLRPESIHSYYKTFHAFFAWVEDEEGIESPMKRIKPPVFRPEVKQPLTNGQVAALLRAAAKSRYPRRDTALLIVLFDTGLRAAECCNLRRGDLDQSAGTLRVVGKGNKVRTVYLGRSALSALARYLRRRPREVGDPLFAGERSRGAALTPSGLFQLVQRLGQTVGVPVGCHDLRRTCAISMLRNGSNVYAVAALLGHGSDIQMTRRYCAVAEADVREQHRLFSPADCLKLK